MTFIYTAEMYHTRIDNNAQLQSEPDKKELIRSTVTDKKYRNWNESDSLWEEVGIWVSSELDGEGTLTRGRNDWVAVYNPV